MIITLFLGSCNRQSAYQLIREPEVYKNSSRDEWNFLLIKPWPNLSVQSGLSKQEVLRLEGYQINQLIVSSQALEQSLRTKIQTGNPLDLFTLNPTSLINGLINKGLLEDLTSLKNDYNLLSSDDPLWELISKDGIVYGIPHSVVLEGLFYDTSIIKKEQFPENREQLYGLIKNLQQKNITPFFINSREMLSYLYQLIVLSLSEEDLYKEISSYKGIELYIKSLEEMKMLYSVGAFDKDAIESLTMTQLLERSFQKGDYAFIPDGTWNIPWICTSYSKDEWDFGAFPALLEGGKPVMIQALGADTVYLTRKERSLQENEDLLVAVRGYTSWLGWLENIDLNDFLGNDFRQNEEIRNNLIQKSRFQSEINYGYPPDYYWDRIFWFKHVIDSIPAYLTGMIEVNDIWVIEGNLFYE